MYTVYYILHCAEAKDENNKLTDEVKQLSHSVQAGLKRTLSPYQNILLAHTLCGKFVGSAYSVRLVGCHGYYNPSVGSAYSVALIRVCDDFDD